MLRQADMTNAASNADISAMFAHTADLLEIDGANPFRIRAYRMAAQEVLEWPESAHRLVKQRVDLSQFPHIGKELAGKIVAIVKVGHFDVLDELKRKFPPGIVELLQIGGLGPKRVAQFYKELDIRSVEDLRRAIVSGSVQKLPRMSPKIAGKILQAIDTRSKLAGKVRWDIADKIAGPLVAWLKAMPGVTRAVAAGSYRRKKDTIGDLDVLVTCNDGPSVIERFTRHPEAARVIARGNTRASIILRSGLQVDLRVMPEESYGAALYYFTGSKQHNIALRAIAAKQGLKINEYGIFKGRKRIAGETEESIFETMGLGYVEPELRENRGELQAAREGRLPKLVMLSDIKGDLHAHTSATDGRNTLSEMASAARGRGYGYIAITDHSRHVTIARGLDERRLRRQCEEIDRMNESMRGFTILKSIEVDILEDGTLDLPDSALKELDVVICSIHYKFDLSPERQTERIIRAMDNPRFGILGHATGRLIGSREGYKFDLERVMRAAKERNCILEVNGQPKRLDIDDTACLMAKSFGVKVALSSDAHSIAELDYMQLALNQARRGWMESGNVVNTLPLSRLRTALKR